MEIVQTSASAAQSSAIPAATDKGEISSDFETFLKMLTAQLNNQDPLNPIESTDYAVQLATFSSVEQQVKTNDLLESMAAHFGASDFAQLAGWIGMEARTPGPTSFDGQPLTVFTRGNPEADGAYFVVENYAGEVVQRSEITVADQSFEWAGVDDNGQPMPDGIYTFRVESFKDADLISDEISEVYKSVTEAKLQSTGTVLVFADGTEALSSAVTGLRTPG